MADLLISPQISLPFRVVKGVVAEHEQDSEQDVTQNAVVIMRYEQGQRSALPRFGIPDLTLSKAPINLRSLTTTIQRQEPGADVEMVQRIVSSGELDIEVDLGRIGGDNA